MLNIAEYFRYIMKAKQKDLKIDTQTILHSDLGSRERVEVEMGNIQRGMRYTFTVKCFVGSESCADPFPITRKSFPCLGMSRLNTPVGCVICHNA